MKRKRFSVEQIVAVLKQAELGLPVADLIRQVGISEQTFYRWKKEYAGLEPAQARELKRIRSATGSPSSACFNTATICSTENRFLFMVISL